MNPRAPRRAEGAATTRNRIVAAAAQVMRTHGLARTTTKEIARAAGFSEATLYKHFRDKEDLFLNVLTEQLPQLVSALKELPGRAGQRTVRANLEDLASQAVAFYEQSMPMVSSLFSEPDLLSGHRQGLRRAGVGPHLANRALAGYLAAEQRLGRVAAGADPTAAAYLLLGACQQLAFQLSFLGEEPVERPRERFVADLVATLLQDLTRR